MMKTVMMEFIKESNDTVSNASTLSVNKASDLPGTQQSFASCSSFYGDVKVSIKRKRAITSGKVAPKKSSRDCKKSQLPKTKTGKSVSSIGDDPSWQVVEGI